MISVISFRTTLIGVALLDVVHVLDDQPVAATEFWCSGCSSRPCDNLVFHIHSQRWGRSCGFMYNECNGLHNVRYICFLFLGFCAWCLLPTSVYWACRFWTGRPFFFPKPKLKSYKPMYNSLGVRSQVRCSPHVFILSSNLSIALWNEL